MNEENSDKSFLAGLRPIRESLPGLMQKDLAEQIGLTPLQVFRIESGTSGTPMHRIKAFAQALCCEVVDLLSVPTPERLAEIRAAYHRRQAEIAEAEAAGTPAKAAGGAA